MSVFKGQLFTNLLNNFINVKKEIQAILVTNQEGSIIAGKCRENSNMDLLSISTETINPILENILTVVTFEKYGMASIITDDYSYQFLKIDEKTILSIVIDTALSIDILTPYSYFLAEKVVQILNANEGDSIQLDVPNFEYEARHSEKLKNQIYQVNLDGQKYLLKVILLGNKEVGKTSIALRYVENRFPMDYRATLGLNILSREYDFFGNEINLSIWDIGGQEYFERFRKIYYRGTQAVFIVFDLTDRKSFENAKEWFWEFELYKEGEDIPIIIVGNKSDKLDQRAINYQEGVLLANEICEKGNSNVSFIETSALSGDNINAAFNLIIHHVITMNTEIEEDILKSDLLNDIEYIINDKGELTLTFITENSFWNPGLQIMADVLKMGGYSKIERGKDEKIYTYSNGVIIKNYTYKNINISDSDIVFLIFNPKDNDDIEVLWNEIVNRMSKTINNNVVFLIGVKESEKIDQLNLLNVLKNNEQIKKRNVSLKSFSMQVDYRRNIYDNFKKVLSQIKYLSPKTLARVSSSNILKEFDLLEKKMNSMSKLIDNVDKSDKSALEKEKDDESIS